MMVSVIKLKKLRELLNSLAMKTFEYQELEIIKKQLKDKIVNKKQELNDLTQKKEKLEIELMECTDKIEEMQNEKANYEQAGYNNRHQKRTLANAMLWIPASILLMLASISLHSQMFQFQTLSKIYFTFALVGGTAIPIIAFKKYYKEILNSDQIIFNFQNKYNDPNIKNKYRSKKQENNLVFEQKLRELEEDKEDLQIELASENENVKIKEQALNNEINFLQYKISNYNQILDLVEGLPEDLINRNLDWYNQIEVSEKNLVLKQN